MPRQTKLLIWFGILLICFEVHSAELFRYRGYIQQYLSSDPQYINPAINDWRRDYWAMGSSLNPSNSLAGWGGTRVSFQPFWGTPSSSFYLELPLLFYTRAVARGHNFLAMYSNNFVMKAQKGSTIFTMSSKRVAENAQWSFVNLEDPLGALKLPNTSAPLLTMKLAGDVLDWDLISYYLADHRCNFVPSTEEIPTGVYAALEQTKEKMRYFDEIPTYKMVRGTKYTNLGRWGFLWGEKQAVNINPRSQEYENTLVNPNHGVGYLKQNIGLDYTGSIPALGGEFTAAAVRSIGNWYQHANGSFNDLGRVAGDAVKFAVSDLKFNNLTVDSSYVMVQPGFQWIAVRDHRYAYVYGFLDPTNPQFYADGSSLYAFGWRALPDHDFILRDPEKKEEYLSDVSTYLGLRAWDAVVEYPGQLAFSERNVFPAIFSLEFQNMENLAAGDYYYYDPIKDEKVVKDYQQVKANLKTQTKTGEVEFSLLERQFKDQDFLQKLTTGYSQSLTNSTFRANFDLARRLRDDVAQLEGIGYKFNTNLSGQLGSGLGYTTSFDYRTGSYEFGLLESTADSVLAAPYNYWELRQYFEQSKNFNLGKVPIRSTAALELIKRKSDLPELSGTALVLYGTGTARPIPHLTATLTLLNVSGPFSTPQADQFPSSSLRDLIDCLFSYQLFGDRANTINLRLTRRYLDAGIKDNMYLEYVSRIGVNTLRLTIGRAPVGNRTSYIVGTKYDVRLNNLEKELLNRPWERWGANGTLSDETFPYIVLNWSMPF